MQTEAYVLWDGTQRSVQEQPMSDAPSPRNEQLRAELASLRLDRGVATAPRRGKRRGGAGKWLALVILAAALAGGAFWDP